jgi:hypothetical protein
MNAEPRRRNNFQEPRRARGVAGSSSITKGHDMGRYLLLWLLGIPIPILLLIWLFGGLH